MEEILKREDLLERRRQELNEWEKKLKEKEEELLKKLQDVTKISPDEAKKEILARWEQKLQKEIADEIKYSLEKAREESKKKIREILVEAMQHAATDYIAEYTVSVVKVPDEEMKGRIIGKEGRNIQALQRATGVDIMVDDTPGMIILSSFDPVRREVARQAMEMLMKDGRIHPGRIEEVVEKAQKEVQKDVIRAAEDAAREVGIIGIPKEILQYLGELKYRTSYGQNVLKHSTEMAHIAGIIAEELGADVKTAKYAALVHDLGKALTHKMEGKHHHISGEILRKYGVPEEVAHAAEAHHDDMDATTTEALIVRVVDAISAARPGARNISAENFAERMKELENVANGFEGIEKSYTISAGREVRVFVKPQDIDDLSAIKLARDIATKIESTMQYPGTVKVNVIRETRAIEFAK